MPLAENNTNHLKKLTAGKSAEWDESYRKDKHFRLYSPDYDGWRYSYYGDDLGSVTSELSIRWLHIVGEEIYYHERRFCELVKYLEQEGLLSE